MSLHALDPLLLLLLDLHLLAHRLPGFHPACVRVGFFWRQEVALLNSDLREIYGEDLSSVSWRWSREGKHSEGGCIASPTRNLHAAPLAGVEVVRSEEQPWHQNQTRTPRTRGTGPQTHADAAAAAEVDLGGAWKDETRREGGNVDGMRESIDGPVSGWHANCAGIVLKD